MDHSLLTLGVELYELLKNVYSQQLRCKKGIRDVKFFGVVLLLLFFESGSEIIF